MGSSATASASALGSRRGKEEGREAITARSHGLPVEEEGRAVVSSTEHAVDLPAVVMVEVLEETALGAEVVKGLRMRPAEEGLLQALTLAMDCYVPMAAARPIMAEVVRQLEDSRPSRTLQTRSALYSPAESRSDAGTPNTA